MKLLRVSNYFQMLFMFIGVILSNQAFCSTQTLLVSEGKRLEAKIALDVMNRISITNDRITNIFGDEGTFVTQTDDQTGQIFIKPTVENGSKSLSLTIITENGVTQDLSLNPTASSAATIVLKNLKSDPSNSNSNFGDCRTSDLFFEGSSSPSKEHFVQIMKQAVAGELPVYNKTIPTRHPISGIKQSLIKTYQSGPYLISVWSLKMTKKNTELDERLFYQPGDFAICLQDQMLKNSKKTFVYVLTRL